MKLYVNRTSPYSRLVLVVAHEKNLAEQLECVWSDPWTNPPELLAVNPYSRVPTLVTDAGLAITDSVCISDYLDMLGGGYPLMPPEGSARTHALRKYGLGRGLIDTAYSVTVERRFHDDPGKLRLVERWLASLERALKSLRNEKGLLGSDGTVDLGDLTLAVGLYYTEFRLPKVKWRPDDPALSAWLDRVGKRPSLRVTAV